jgi:hypothetical protein
LIEEDTIDAIKRILSTNGYTVYEDTHFKDLDITFDLVAQRGDQLVVLEFITDERYALSRMMELQGKAGQLRQYFGVSGESLEIYAIVAVLVEVYEKLFRRFEEVRQNPVACRKLLVSIDSSSPEQLIPKLEFDLLPVLPFNDSKFVLQNVDGLTILTEKLKDDILASELLDSFKEGGEKALQEAIERRFKEMLA